MPLIAPRPRHLALLLMAMTATPAFADIASGLWSQHTRVLTGGAAVQETDGEVCYPAADATDAARVRRAQRNAQHLLDASCKAAPKSNLDPMRFSVTCTDTAAGSGSTTISESGLREFSQHIDFRNDAVGGIDMQYEIKARWLGPDCAGLH
jgi:hypothetical protein